VYSEIIELLKWTAKKLMSTLAETINEKSSRPPAEKRIIIPNVSWATYESLLADLADQSTIRLTYDRGKLEIMSPLSEHEKLNRTIALLVEILSEELNIDIERLGSTTFRRKDIERGFEPDSCFYIQNEASVSGKERIDLNVDPPPDLVIEVDITHDSLDKFPIYAQIGVPEFWRHDGEKLTIYRLSENGYSEAGNSSAFPLITAGVLTDLLQKSRTMKSTALSRSFREWIKNHRSYKE
jgi:Uma2 family endonuclease